MKDKFTTAPGTLTVDTGTTGILDTAADQIVFDVEGLEHAVIYLNQITDAGTVSLQVDTSIDGTNWAPLATKADTDFAAGANKSIQLTNTDAHGADVTMKLVRVTVAAITGGTYSATVCGRQRLGYA